MPSFFAELHCHTAYSDGWASPEGCIRQARKRGLQILAITDHNTAEGGLPYWESPLQDGVLVVPGEEVSTDAGHLLAYFVKETISPGPLDDVLAQVRAQNALAFMAHPWHIPLGNRWRKRRIFKLSDARLSRLDGIEVENGHNRSAANRLAWQLAADRKLTAIAGSDAHFPPEIGNARCKVTMPDLSFASLRAALLHRDSVTPLPRRWNAYGVYLFVGLLNKVQRRRYG